MAVHSCFHLVAIYLLRTGTVIFLLLFFTGASFCQTPFSSPIRIIPFPDDPAVNRRIAQSQQILKALLLEQDYRFVEALGVWKMLPQSSETIRDHVFQIKLIEQGDLEINSIPETVFSIKVAVSFLKWQKRWREAYQLLQARSALIIQDEQLRFMQVVLAFYLGEYEAAQQQLKAIGSGPVHDKLQLQMMWSWYYMLSEKGEKLLQLLEELEDHATYHSASFLVKGSKELPWHKMRHYALKTLTRFPSDRELTEITIRLFLKQGALEELEKSILPRNTSDGVDDLWTVRAEIYLQTDQFAKLKSLLNDLHSEQTDQIELLTYRAEMAIAERNWPQLRIVAEEFRHRFPYLQDGELFMALYQQASDSEQN